MKGSVFKLLQRTAGAAGGAGLDREAAKAVVLCHSHESPQARGRQRAVTTRNFARVIEARAPGGLTHEER